jgi:hypothetical protein
LTSRGRRELDHSQSRTVLKPAKELIQKFDTKIDLMIRDF